MSTATLETELKKFGLNHNQAVIYLALIENKELRIQEIAKITGIARSSVYESLKGLYELGIAEEVVEENYKKIRPYSVGAIHHGLDEELLKISRLKKDLNKLEKTLISPQVKENGPVMRLYRGRSGARQLYWNSLKAQGTVLVYSDWGRERYVGIKYYERFVSESRARHIQEKVLINLSPATLESIKRFNYPNSVNSRTKLADIRVIDKKLMKITGDTLIYDSTYACVYLKSVEINGFEIQNQNFVETQQSVFDTLWSLARPISEYLGS